MTVMAKRLARQIGVGRFLLLWGFSLLAGLSRRASGPQTFPLHLLSVLGDQLYFTFSVLPSFLFLCSGVMEDDPEAVILRYGSYGRYFMAKWRGMCLLCTETWAVQLTLLAFTGCGYPLTAGWISDSGYGSYHDVLSLMAGRFPTPWTALVCAALHLLAGYWLTALLALWLGHFLFHTDAIKALMALFVLAVFWVKLPIMAQPPFCYLTGINHWMLMLHNLTEPWRFPLTIAVTLPLLCGMLWSAHRKWRRSVPSIRHQPKLLSKKNGGLL